MAINQKRGGKRTGAGRKPGTPNKLTFEIKKAASLHGDEILTVLMKIIRNEETPVQTIVAACREVLNRGFGTPAISVEIKPINLNLFPPKEVLDAIYDKALDEATERDKFLVGRRERLSGLLND